MSAGPPPGIDLYADIKGRVISPVIALMVISSASVALRLVSKYTAKADIQLDDYLIIAALVVALGTGCLTILACYEGIGKHIWNPTVKLAEVLKILWAYEYLYGSVIPLTKLSIIFYFYRLFPVRAFRRLLYLVLFLVIGWWIAILVTAIVQCRPYHFFWDQYTNPTVKGKCINIEAFFLGNGGASVVTDFLILMTPVPMVWSLQMPLAKRLSVLGIFALGGFVCIAGVIRLVVLSKMFASADLTWGMSQAFIWSSVEPNIGIVCACLPTLYPLLRRCLPSWFPGSSLNASSAPAYGTGASRLRSQNGDFYALTDRSKDQHSKDNKSEDEIGLTNEIRGSERRANEHIEDGMGGKGMNIIVKRDVTVE
ncbi:hypothetical protein F5884DRAFT_440581 [Xylogone sp. PMI_703]|nr:hypothetical protein F5884DRAFT_440581 [Xylogone sp. PMI_703]